MLKNFLYGTNPLHNYVGLIDARNHDAEGNLKSEKQLAKTEIVRALLEWLGWDSSRYEDAIAREDRKRRLANNVVGDPLFKRQKRLNELFDLHKAINIHKDMIPQRVLMWRKSLLKGFSLQIRADKETYYLELQNDLLALIKRKNRIGKIYYDRQNLLKQGAPHQQDDLFLDDDPPQPEVLTEPPQPQEVVAPPPPPSPPVPEPEAAAPKISTPAQEFAEWKRETGLYDASLREFQEFAGWKQKMDLYDTSLLDL